MYSNVFSTNEKLPLYPTSNSQFTFAEYIAHSRSLIEERRPEFQSPHENNHLILDANSPFELYPAVASSKDQQYGALLIHGLLDCPFSLKDIGLHLQKNGIFCRAILLPGHGTMPEDLLTVSYQNWIQAVQYGIETLKKEVEKIILIGYSTGAALSIYHALQNTHVAGLILLSPAIRIKAPVDIVVGWQSLLERFSENKNWVYREKEIDYTKYLSICFNAVHQVTSLTEIVKDLGRNHRLPCPIFMTVSREDETISSHQAINFFTSMQNEDSKLLLYTAQHHTYPDTRIVTRNTCYTDLSIKHFSHMSIPFAPDNAHYGQSGDYVNASHRHLDNAVFGAYNRIEVRFFDYLQKIKLIRKGRRELTYNPDFNFMIDEIVKFIKDR